MWVKSFITCLSDHGSQFLELSYPSSLFHTNIYTFQDCRSFSQENGVYFSKLIEKESLMDVYLAPNEDKYKTFMHHSGFTLIWLYPEKYSVKNNWITQNLKYEKKAISLVYIKPLENQKKVKH